MTQLESVRAFGRGVLVIGTLLGVPAGVTAQDSARAQDVRGERGGLPADVQAAQGFLLAAYPDLLDRPLEIHLRREPGGVVVTSVVDLSVAAAEGTVTAPLVTARFDFAPDGQLRRYDGFGPLLHEAQNLKLQEELLENPRWVESDADVSLTRMGAASTFAPPDAKVASQTAAVAGRLGAQAVSGARFEWHTAGTSPQGGRVFRSRPAWLAEAVAVAADGAPRVYQFEYEPFGGRLTAVTVQEAR